MRFLAIALLLLPVGARAEKPLLKVSSDSAVYAAGATAKLKALPLVVPHHSEDDFFIGASLNGEPISLVQVPNGPGIASAVLAQPGSYVFTVQLFLENAKLAASLNDSIKNLRLANGQIDTQLSQTTDPNLIQQLEAQKAANTAEILEAQTELDSIRHPFGASQSLTLTAQ